ncbi:histone acetyltransferase type B catalytic subunit-like isoform X1 [Euwallacea fornicatus]|uniref:histone acetyltransferase type B catalytic subunit-like isoform X1 n=2 Tax=Euwallacea fornicatus TaxID=995702 RepID=UPI00338F4F7B
MCGTAGASGNTQVKNRGYMATYKKSVCKVVTFKIIYEEHDLESENAVSFKPEMSHQIFGDSESIFGYKQLAITINMLHNSCLCYLDLKSGGKINKAGMKPDDIVATLDAWLPSDTTRSCDEFVEWIKNEQHDQMYGDVIGSFKCKVNTSETSNSTITYKITENDMHNDDFKDFHARFETYIIWFIDAANYIDMGDPKWVIFYVYEEGKHQIKNISCRTPVAFCTVYKFYAYPNKYRPRISQIFVLPSHQRQGIGTNLYATISKKFRLDEEVVDIAVEEPTSDFQKIRDLEDCGVMHKTLLKQNINYFTTSSKKIFQLGHKNKIGKKQMQRVYDILGLYYASQKGYAHHKRIVANIKTRTKDHSDRECQPGKRFCKIGPSKAHPDVMLREVVDVEFERYYSGLAPSLEYLKVKMDDWLQKNSE